jgi:4,5-DOPA dioxygenase extradiol
MLAIEPNSYAKDWEALGRRLPRPRAVLMVSAHWMTRGTSVTAMSQPETIHDFGGFPRALFEVQYPAPGSPLLAQQVKDLLAPIPVHLEEFEWGLDHGSWAVLKFLFPNADVPIIQLSLDSGLTALQHYELAQKLKFLREDGVLIMASGNVVHNLRAVDFSSRVEYPWAIRFNEFFKEKLLGYQFNELIEPVHSDAKISIPTPEHYWPALYILAQLEGREEIQIITDGIDIGSISMLSFQIG